MNKLIKLKIYILLSTLLLAGCSVDTCENDNKGLCELEKISDLQIEESAKISIAVFNQDYGEDLVSNWNITNPEHHDLLSYEIIDPSNSEELLLLISDYDLVQIKNEDVPLYLDNLAPLDDSFSEILENEPLSKFSSQINQTENYFMPFAVEGLLFAYNKTMLEEFGVNLIDEDENGLADAIDSFEKIAELAKTWRKENRTYLDQPIKDIFSFPLNDQMAMIPFLQNSDYRLIQGVSAEMMDLDQGLLLALEVLKELGKDAWRFDESLTNDTSWNYEQALIDQSAPFLLIGNWMYYDHYQTSKAYELVFTKLPTLNDYDLSTLSTVSGFVLNKDTKYPNAANMVLKHIKSLEGTQIAINNGLIPLINIDLLEVEGLMANKNIREQITAYQYSDSSPLQAFEQNPEIRGWNVFLENDFREQISSVFLNEKKPEEVVEEFREIIGVWLSDNDIIIKGLNDKQELDNIKEISEKEDIDEDEELGTDN